MVLILKIIVCGVKIGDNFFKLRPGKPLGHSEIGEIKATIHDYNQIFILRQN